MFKGFCGIRLLFPVILFVWAGSLSAQTPEREDRQSAIIFSGEIKPVIYVKDVLASQKFYTNVLGFGFESFHDYKTGESLAEWTAQYPPIYAEIFINEQKLGLHLPQNEKDEARIGGVKLYVRVEDVRLAFEKISAQYNNVSEIKETDWMDFFAITDPDGNEIILAETNPERHSIYPW